MRGEDIVIKANPLSSGTPVVSDLAALTGVDQGTVAAKLRGEWVIHLAIFLPPCSSSPL